MSDNQISNEEYRKAVSGVIFPIISILALKWIILFGLNRWARSMK